MAHHPLPDPRPTSAARRKASVVVASLLLGTLGVVTFAWAATIPLQVGSLSITSRAVPPLTGAPYAVPPFQCRDVWSSDYRQWLRWEDPIGVECTTTTSTATTAP